MQDPDPEPEPEHEPSASETHLLDAMENELRLAHKMVQELKNAPRASPHKRQKPCCFCADKNIIQKGAAEANFAQQQHLIASDNIVSPDSFCTPPPLSRSSARSSPISYGHLFTPRRSSRPSSHVSHKLFEESPANQDGLMLAVDKFLAAGDFFPPS
ncbi:hypothetical protein GOP47_0013805 [Adiantum capillus-veneris]|uniref:Uncharacterized protein n=1 Tax=Adiantum capillus-veneris TaxID=13818 RepID=A0A9D4UP79_ADICA|nr:hypothetical protein GOP47_0013805 [Adiantum capillus-veneris]